MVRGFFEYPVVGSNFNSFRPKICQPLRFYLRSIFISAGNNYSSITFRIQPLKTVIILKKGVVPKPPAVIPYLLYRVMAVT